MLNIITKYINYHKRKRELKIAVQAHIFHVDLTDEIIGFLKNITLPFDLYISTDTLSKKVIIEQKIKDASISDNTHIETFENRGRDVAPFLFQMSDCIDNYDYVCHIHTKKSEHLKLSAGDDWRKYLLNNLLGSKSYIREILDIFENNPKIGIICPYSFKLIVPVMNWGDNLETSE